MGMIIVPFDLIEDMEADSEDTEFPVTNLVDAHSRKPWAAASGVYSATINIKTIGAAADSLTLYYLLGDSVKVTIYDDVNLGGSVVVGPTTTDLLETDDYFTNDIQIPGVWTPYTSPGVPHSAKVEISRTGGVPEIGRAFAGKRWAMDSKVNWGLGRAPEDHSIIYDIDDGYEYIYQRNIRRIYNGDMSIRGNPPTEYFTFLHMIERIGPNPVPVVMEDGVTPLYQYLIYARICDVKGTEAKYNESNITFTLKEWL